MNKAIHPTPSLFATRLLAVENAFDTVGIPRAIADNLQDATESASVLCAHIQRRTTAQAIYDHVTNMPTEIVDSRTYSPRDSVRKAIPGAIGTYLEWDVHDALELCADILEDVNAHAESAAVRKMIGGAA